jgi:hypothetical protein
VGCYVNYATGTLSLSVAVLKMALFCSVAAMLCYFVVALTVALFCVDPAHHYQC